LRDFFRPPAGRSAGPLLYFPFAAVSISFDESTRRARKRFARMGYELVGAHRARRPYSTRGCAGFVVSGGNTFRLLDEMQRRGWLARVKREVLRGKPYAGWSAGANLACPTIRTTNDMPVVEPASLSAMGLLPFQLNPHYTERRLSGHGGESRDQRIAEFVALNPGVPVLGLREGSLLRREGDRLSLRLGPGAVLFSNRRRTACRAGADLSFLLG
jgi:dipeptidase E